MTMITQFLAEAARFSMTDVLQFMGWVTTFVVAILGAILVPVFKARWESKAKSEMSIGPQPFIVDFKKEFLTRAEHEVYLAEVRADFQRMEGTILRMSDKVETKHLELLATIERAAKTGVDGRVHLWEALKPLGNEVAALKATSNVAEQLAKLATAITQQTTATTHGKTTR
jgi:hypothetical protein